MTKTTTAILLVLMVFVIVPSTARAELTPVKISTSYNTDSDGVSSTNYNISTERKNKPWNFTYANTRIKQSDGTGISINEAKFISRWQQQINEESAISAWVGYANSNAWKFAAFGAQYHGAVNYTDHMWLQYEHDSVPTVAAYRDHIFADRLTWSYQMEIDKRLVLDTTIKYASFSDGNFRKTLGVTLTKDFSPRYRLGLAYLYDTSDTEKHSVFYLPKSESSLSIIPQIALPVGDGVIVLKMSKSLFARNTEGKIKRTTYGVGYHLDNLAIEMQYYRDDNYWSRDYIVSWENKW